MYPLKKIYTSVASNLGGTTASYDPVTEMEAAQKVIQQSPRLAKGYLTSGQLYTQQGKLYDALNVYQQGLRNVSTHHAEYPKIEMGKNNLLIMLAARPSSNFVNQLPNEILYLIFRQLGIRDLIRCSGVCQTWNKYLLDWHEFWDLFRAVTDRVEWQFAEAILRRKTNLLDILPGVEIENIFNLLRLVKESDNQRIRKLILREAALGFFLFGEHRISEIEQSSNFPIRELELIDCYTSLQTTFYFSLLPKLSNFTHVSFSQSTVSPAEVTYQLKDLPRAQDIIKPNVKLTFLTSLKLSAIYLGKSATAGITRILQQSPNLIHLYLDTRATIIQSYITRQATKHCPYLETLVLSKSAMMAQTLSSWEDSSTETQPKLSNLLQWPSRLKLRRLVFTEYSAHYNTNYVPSIIKRARHSLELMILCINCTYTLDRLPDFGGRRLREVQLFPDERMVALKFTRAKLSRIFSSFFRSCPTLEVIVISGNTEYGEECEFISVDDQLLQSIAEYCPRISKLVLSNCNHHSHDAILNFATIGGSRLTHLELDMDPAKAQTLIEKLPALRNLYIHDDNPYYTMGATEYDLRSVKSTLEQRGGSLIFRDFS